MNKPKEINKYIKEVKKTTGIVEDSIEKGNYSLAIEKLEVTLNDNENKNKYVFYQEEEKKFKNILTFSAIGVLSIIYFYYFYMCMGTMIYSNEYKGYAAVGITIILILLALNMMFVRKMIQQSGFNARYNQYYTDLRFKNIEIIDDLVSYTKISDEKIVIDKVELLLKIQETQLIKESKILEKLELKMEEAIQTLEQIISYAEKVLRKKQFISTDDNDLEEWYVRLTKK